MKCARDGCEVEFSQKTHNQRYHDAECCRLATNERLKVKYHEGRARRRGAVRLCAVCGTTRLSRYNESRVCSGCEDSHRKEL